ncbi:MAG TPA: heparan-alpha-glucosaminide N-acetyltransferase domain-containing protein [Chitinophagaceae bacterium]|nr:heparan-alpha-glucosaminide N-acetyltransferase domain-containing protein [Chitinophagaceae bacterium]
MEALSTAPPTRNIPQPRTYRLNSIDLLRGIVMIIMALDHTRDFIHIKAFTEDPLNLQTTTPILFFTRFITHYCAPVFVFLSGTSIFLQSLRKSRKELSAFILKRGLWLILAEVTFITFGITFDIQFSFFFLQVIWAIGISMVILSLLVRLPFNAILLLGIVIVFGHNLLDIWEQGKQSFPWWYSLLHRQNFIPLGENGPPILAILYPFLPWTGIMLLGYCFGKWYSRDVNRKQRDRSLLLLGLAVIAFFVIMRWTEVYGDPIDWSQQKNTLYTFMSFINTQKYPPSLLFACVTLGPALVVLALLGNVRNRITDIITVYGRVPFFYYILHFYLLHIIMAVLYLSRGHSFREGMAGVPGLPFKFAAIGEGYSLGIVYLVWILVVAGLYPLCRWYSEYKRRNKHWWLSYV